MGVFEILALASTQTTYWATADAAREFLAQVAELAPDWSKADDSAQWYAIDADGLCAWYRCRPETKSNFWSCDSVGAFVEGKTDMRTLPLGFDWRLAIWQRPE